MLRRTIFWIHLLTGVTIGAVVFLMSATGVLLAYEKALIAWAESDVARVAAAGGSARLPLDELAGKARAAAPDMPLSAVSVRSAPEAAVLFSFGGEETRYVDPYSGEVRGTGATGLRKFLHFVTDVHRYLGAHGPTRDLGRGVTGAANLAFAGLVASGLYLWWPRKWTGRALRAVSLPSLSLSGWRRDWNWHNALGLWAAPVLLVVTLSGAVISYPWASDLLLRLAGSEPQARPPGRGGQRGGPGQAPPLQLENLDELVAAANRQAPHWRAITIRFPAAGANEVGLFVEEADSAHPYPRSVLTLDVASAAVKRWEPFGELEAGRQIRMWIRPLHTGEAAGLAGQTIAALASLIATVLVWTGLALTWRRLRRYADDPARRAPLAARGELITPEVDLLLADPPLPLGERSTRSGG